MGAGEAGVGGDDKSSSGHAECEVGMRRGGGLGGPPNSQIHKDKK